jgi:hypothetical protein
MNMPANQQFGIAWIGFALAFACHFVDEATHGFLPMYNSVASKIRIELSLPVPPIFSFTVWITLLIGAFVLLLCVSPLAFRGNHWLRVISKPIAVLAGVLNAALHITSSLYFHRWMPGVYSSPILLIAAIYLLAASRSAGRAHSIVSLQICPCLTLRNFLDCLR